MAVDDVDGAVHPHAQQQGQGDHIGEVQRDARQDAGAAGEESRRQQRQQGQRRVPFAPEQQEQHESDHGEGPYEGLSEGGRHGVAGLQIDHGRADDPPRDGLQGLDEGSQGLIVLHVRLGVDLQAVAAVRA